ncbi:Hsp20/alpha crystallin family protein [[Eubacterium] cellulosolvens]
MLRRRVTRDIEAIEKEIDELFNELFFGRPMWDPTMRCLEPLAHVRETDDKFIVTIDLPYVKKEDIKLEITPEDLKIEAKMQKHILYDRWGTIQRRCRFDTFHKEIHFPSEISADGAKAKFKEGFLIIEIPKRTTRYKISID